MYNNVMAVLAEPSVSVVMPVYNAERYLDEAIFSVTSQTLKSWELIVIDDGSNNGSAMAAEKHAEKDARIKVFKRPRRGLVAALNEGVTMATAPLIARMDADDISLPGRLEKQLEAMEADKDLDIVSCMVEVFPDKEAGEGMLIYAEWLNGLLTDSEIKRDMFVESPLAHPSVMFRKDIVVEAGGYRGFGWPEDYELWMRLMEKGCRFGKVAEKLFLWRDSRKRLSRTSPEYSMNAFRKLKAHYLLKGPLADRESVTLIGAGRTGRWWCRELLASGVRIDRFVDADPRKVRAGVGSIPVLPPEALEKPVNGDFILCCVGARGARDKIRHFMTGLGYRETDSFLFIA